MKNLIVYKGDCFDVFSRALAAKKDDNLKNRLIHNTEVIKECFNEYQQHFDANTLELLNPKAELAGLQIDLLSLYGYDTKTIRKYREDINSLQPRCIRYTCQSCGFEQIECIDHLLPKESFPEYSVNPINLLPSCSKCNTHKSSIWKDASGRLFLNLFTDRLPDEQYLFVNIINPEGDIDFEFYLDNPGNTISATLFRIIQSHYNRLHLLDRLRLKSISHLTELQNSIQVRMENLDLQSIFDEVIITAERNKASYGSNYYKSVLEIALVQSSIFKALFSDD